MSRTVEPESRRHRSRRGCARPPRARSQRARPERSRPGWPRPDLGSDPLVAIFRHVTGWWPGPIRNEFGAAAVDTFAQRLEAARARRGPKAWARIGVELAAAAWLALRWRLPDRPLERRPVRDRRRALGSPGPPRRSPFSCGGLAADLRHALRFLRHRPGFAALVLLTLSMGVGLNASVFAVVDAVLLEPLPYADADRLVGLWGTREDELSRFGNVSWPDLADFRAQLRSFAVLGGYTSPRLVELRSEDSPALVPAARVTPGFFETLGIEPMLGRLFSVADGLDEYASGRIVLLSDGLWRARFGAAPEVLGRTVHIDDVPHRVVGILAPGVLGDPWRDIGLWVPVGQRDASRGSRNLNAIGRLADGADIRRAQDELDGIGAALAAEYPESNQGVSAHIIPLRDLTVGDEAPHLLLLLQGVAGIVLLIACGNLAHLYVVRALDRRHEASVKLALGASPFRIARSLLVELLLLGGAGTLVGLALARWLPGYVLGRSPYPVPRSAEVGIDGTVLLFAVATTLAVIAGTALIPVWAVARKAGRGTILRGAGVYRDARRAWFRQSLTVSQVALAVVLLLAAGMLLGSLRELSAVDPGFDPEDVLAVSVRLPSSRYSDAASALEFQERVLRRLRALPAVNAAGGVSMLPLTGENLCDSVTLEGRAEPESDCVEWRSVTPGYFASMGIGVRAGRAFTDADQRNGLPVAMVNRTLASSLFGDATAIGGRIDGRRRTWTIVGVVDDVRMFGLGVAARPAVYLPYEQAPFPLLTFVVKHRPRPSGLEAQVGDAVASPDPLLAVPAVRLLGSLVRDSLAGPRFRSQMLTSFAALSLLLAMTGVGGALAHAVQERRREIGIRMTLGCSPAGIRRLIIESAARLTAAGLLVGGLSGLAAGRLLRGYLFGVTSTEPTILFGVASVLSFSSLFAAFVPMRRALRVEPIDSLRQQ